MPFKQTIKVESIPTIIWGNPSDHAYIFVHGRLSQKEDAARFAEIAEGKGYQVVSFDLPEHGERKSEDYPCTVQNAVHDLGIIRGFVTGKWRHISLYANSFGAYFSLVAYRELKFKTCLFLSPILDMEKLIQGMMKWAGVTEDYLREKQEITTSTGDILSWPYYAFVKENPILKWDNPTWILYGSNDNLTPREIVDAFAAKFQCNLEVLKNGEHFFHTEEQLEVVDRWLNLNI